ncbi:MAG TPA: 30S ribosome-binding factor RbfA [Dehalococcoidia bacterium]|nr:30S ribosome-binding factor RbfA [Dehalococcoidia bacterium]
MTRRTERLGGLFRSELAELIHDELRDPRITGLISITQVEVSPDLENATVHVSVMGDAEEQKASLAALTHAAPWLRRELLHRVHIRKVPALEFALDRSIEEGARMLDLMRQVAAERDKHGSGE